MDAKTAAIKIAEAQSSVFAAAEKIAGHFGFDAEMDAMHVNVAAAKQPEIARIRQLEGIAALLNKVNDALQNDGPEQTGDDDKPARKPRK